MLWLARKRPSAASDPAVGLHQEEQLDDNDTKGSLRVWSLRCLFSPMDAAVPFSRLGWDTPMSHGAAATIHPVRLIILPHLPIKSASSPPEKPPEPRRALFVCASVPACASRSWDDNGAKIDVFFYP
jgi:hypothetical protein